MDNDGKVILGVVKGYAFSVIEPFIRSLRQTKFGGDLVLFVRDVDRGALRSLSEMGVILVPFRDEFPFIQGDVACGTKPQGQMSVNCGRYFIYWRYLNSCKRQYDQVLVTDVRDVIFQADPFVFDDNGLCCFLEDKSMSLETSLGNSAWIRDAFGKKMLDEIGSNFISCSGVVMGGLSAILEYLTAMMSVIATIQPIGGVDQAVHNYLIYKQQLNCSLIDNDSGPVFTLQHKCPDSVTVNPDGYIESGYGIPPVVHQYDRHARLTRVVQQKYFQP